MSAEKRVYCKDCRFSGDISFFGLWMMIDSRGYCDYKNPEDYETIGTEYSGFYKKQKPQSYHPLKTGLNKDGNCPYYEREWWKFWLRERNCY